MGQKSDRRWAKRKARRLYRRMDNTMTQVLELKEAFEPDHPDYASMLDGIAKMILQVQDFVSAFYKLAWGHVPTDWYQDG